MGNTTIDTRSAAAMNRRRRCDMGRRFDLYRGAWRTWSDGDSFATLFIVLAIAVMLLACSGCGTIKYGDGKVGGISISPAVEQLAKAADSQFPGSGAKIREYYSTAAIDRVPVGYTVRWTAYLDGKPIDERAIVRVPTLAPVAGSPVVAPPGAIEAPAPGDEIGDLLEAIGGLPK